ncbi:MAG: hypothetical protein R2731_07545 [Nocardioides sp.]
MLWWIGNAVLLLVVVPVLVALLNRVLAALERIRGASDEILAGGGALAGELDGVPDALAETGATVHDVAVGAARYGGSVAKLLGWRRTDMPVVAWVTLIITTLIIAAAALGLLRVIFHLRAVAQALDGVIAGVGVVADRTSTVPASVESVNASLKPVRDFAEAI